LAAEGLLHDDVLDFDTHIHIAEAPPEVLFAIEDEAVVVATFGRTIMNQDSVQVVRHVAIVRKSCTQLL